MGLVELNEKMTTSAIIPATGPSKVSVSSVNTSPTSSSSPDQVVRKKRTFDIAFLTGQCDRESGHHSDRDSPNNNNIERKCASFMGGQSPYNLTQEATNSDSSSIDVMTNGSLSEPESQQHSPSSSIPGEASPPLRGAAGPINHQLGRGLVTSHNGGISHRNDNNSGNDQHHEHHLNHHVDIKSNGSCSLVRGSGVASTGGGIGNKSRNNRSPVKEEIRIESRRTIDINQTVDSLKIKENLHFSTLLPSSAIGLAMSAGAGGDPSRTGSSAGGSSGNTTRTISVSSGADLSLPQLASTMALLPHVARFPLGLPGLASGGVLSGGNHIHGTVPGGIPFHARMEKSESINISYPKLRVGPFSDPYAALAASAAGGYPYSNLLGVPPELARHPHFTNPLGSPNGGGGPQQGNGGGGNSQHISQQPSPTSPSSGSPCGISTSTTLLPPSLTTLNLPAQNVCAKCNIGFRMTSDLVYHMRSHHKRDADPVKRQREEKLKCPVCHETFRERHHLTRHMTAHQDRAEEA